MEQLADAPGELDPAVSWEPMQVVAFNRWVEEGLVPGMQMMNLISAKRLIPKGAIRGAIGSARNTALDFALELQAASPDAGSQNGPTVKDEPIASTVYSVTDNIYGHGTNIAHGSESVQTSTVSVGDLSGLLLAAREIGLTDTQAQQELAGVAVAPAEERESKTEAFLEKVQGGLFTIGTNASTTIVVNQLEQLLNQYLGI